MADRGYLEQDYLAESYVAANTDKVVRSQVNLVIGDKTKIIRAQLDRASAFSKPVNAQIDRQIPNATASHGNEVKRGKNLHVHQDGYLEGPYGEGPYLTDRIGVLVRSQVDRLVTQLKNVRSQIDRKIPDRTNTLNAQVDRRIDTSHSVKSQVLRLKATIVKSQINQVLYNTTNLRILAEFPSRGVSGENWTSNSTLAGDFSPYNLNTDIVEQVWRSNNVTSGVQLVCDTEVAQGVFVDTLAILNHNLTTSASVLWQASDDAGFSSTPFVQLLSMTRDNAYWIAESAPLSAYRYHRFLISDPTNANSYLEIGTIVFGSSVIFQGECFVDEVRRETRHYADAVETEAFTNVSNDRAVKYAVSLEFRRLNYNKGNYSKMRQIFDYARTSLKCLWIPTPQFPGRFATFAKLTAIPEETHKVISETADYVDFSITTDEGR